jgi:flavin reductase (DIM6/NTAB) family NADH-FMN oxidoreductase RutF
MVPSLKAAFASFPTGVTAVGALVDGEPVGMAISSFASVSLDPPLLGIFVQNTSRTWPVLRRAPAIGVSVLAGRHASLGRQLSGPGDRFAGLDWSSAPSGAVFIGGAAADFDCVIHSSQPAGDHTLVLLEVTAVEHRPGTPPLVFHSSGLRTL